MITRTLFAMFFTGLLCGVAVAEDGLASWYTDHETASCEPYSSNTLAAAHKTLPLGTVVNVTNVANGKSVVVRINDRGPYIKGRIIDLTPRAFSAIADLDTGIVKVKLTVIERPHKKTKPKPSKKSGK